LEKITPGRLHLFLTVIFLLAWLNGANPVLRFNNENANLTFRVIIYLLPLIMIINGFNFKSWWSKVINAVVLFFPMMLCLILILGAAPWFSGAVDFRARVIDTVNAGSYAVKVTRSDGTAVSTTLFRFQQEKEIGLGLLLVKEIYSVRGIRAPNDHTKDPKIISLKGDELEFYNVSGQKEVIYLKPNIYF